MRNNLRDKRVINIVCDYGTTLDENERLRKISVSDIRKIGQKMRKVNISSTDEKVRSLNEDVELCDFLKVNKSKL